VTVTPALYDHFLILVCQILQNQCPLGSASVLLASNGLPCRCLFLRPEYRVRDRYNICNIFGRRTLHDTYHDCQELSKYFFCFCLVACYHFAMVASWLLMHYIPCEVYYYIILYYIPSLHDSSIMFTAYISSMLGSCHWFCSQHQPYLAVSQHFCNISHFFFQIKIRPL
jgi:hypothetical protein